MISGASKELSDSTPWTPPELPNLANQGLATSARFGGNHPSVRPMAVLPLTACGDTQRTIHRIQTGSLGRLGQMKMGKNVSILLFQMIFIMTVPHKPMQQANTFAGPKDAHTTPTGNSLHSLRHSASSCDIFASGEDITCHLGDDDA